MSTACRLGAARSRELVFAARVFDRDLISGGIMASGHVNRIKGRTHGRTDQACNVKIVLANQEPSTHGTQRPLGRSPSEI
jgi:hypothetical protein